MHDSHIIIRVTAKPVLPYCITRIIFWIALAISGIAIGIALSEALAAYGL